MVTTHFFPFSFTLMIPEQIVKCIFPVLREIVQFLLLFPEKTGTPLPACCVLKAAPRSHGERQL